MAFREPLDVLRCEDVHEDALQMKARLLQCQLMVTGGHFDALLPGSPERTLQHHAGSKEYVVVRASAQSVVDNVVAGRLGDAPNVSRLVGEEACEVVLCRCTYLETFDHTVEDRVHATTMHRLSERVLVVHGTFKERGRSNRKWWFRRLEFKVHPATNFVNVLHGGVVPSSVVPHVRLLHGRFKFCCQLWAKFNPPCQNPFANLMDCCKRSGRVNGPGQLLHRLC